MLDRVECEIEVGLAGKETQVYGGADLRGGLLEFLLVVGSVGWLVKVSIMWLNPILKVPIS